MSSNEILLSLEDRVRIIQFNRPKKKNAFNANVYKTIRDTLNSDAVDDNVVLTILTGKGEYYSSGFDIQSAMTEGGTNSEKIGLLRDMILSIATYPKLLICLVNGPAIGISVTTAALCDIIYASDRATFQTPFVRLGLCPEGCSSFTFPQIMGRSKASEVLFLGKKLTAQEAYQFGFVSEIIPHENLEQFKTKLKKLGKDLSLNSVKVTKRLILGNFKNVLSECNKREMEELGECFLSEDFSLAVTNFFNRKSKL